MEHSQQQHVIAYYKDCLQADTRTLTLYNIFGAKAESPYIIEGNEELVSGHAPLIPVSRQWGEAVGQQLALHRDKKLYYCTFFLVGRAPALGRKEQKICAPLLLYPATLTHQNESYYLEVNLEKRTLNVNFLNLIKQPQAPDLYSVFGDGLPRGPLEIDHCSTIKQLLETHLEGVNAEDAYLYPKLTSEAGLKKKLHSNYLNKLTGYELVSASGAVVLRQTAQSGGLITELATLATADAYSAPLAALLGGKAAHGKPLPTGLVPVVLNHAQETAMNMVSRYALSMIAGPPGTGKSYTMAALAADFVSKGKSVLVVAKSDQAVDVIADKAAAMGMESLLLRAGKKNFMRDLKQRLTQILGGVPPMWQQNEALSRELDRLIGRLDKLIEVYQQKFETQVGRELSIGEYLAKHGDTANIFHKLKKRYLSWATGKEEPLWVLINELEKYLQMRTARVQQKLKADYEYRLWHALKHYRASFANYLKSLRARTSADQDMYLARTNLNHVFNAYPLWFTRMADISDVLPLQCNLFDLVIIDEATQSDIATALPVLQRAQRAVVVGDPNQLRHISFLAQTTQATLQKKHNIYGLTGGVTLDYRNDSLLDAVSQALAEQAQTTFLDEHFRSTPRIISFSNRHIYRNSMRVMTQVPKVMAQRSLFWQQIPNGKQTSKGHNTAEGLAVVQTIQTIIAEQANLPADLCQTIGVLSPFRDQTDHLADLLTEHLGGNELQRHRVRCGTAHSFQGDERDIMLLSLAIDDNAHPTSYRHMNRHDVFNVAITRARARQYLFTSFSPARLKPDSLLALYLAHVQQDAEVHQPNLPVKDCFLSEVCQALHGWGAYTWQAFDVAGLEVDIIFKLGKKKHGINLIGYPGQFQASFNLERYKVLARAGLRTFPLPYSWWYFERNTCLAQLKQFIDTAHDEEGA